jgi:Xaa-Pro aminopeptidase
MTLAPMDVAGRGQRLRGRLAGVEVDALLVTNLTNIRYLTVFTGSAALLLVSDGGLTFVTDGRYGQQAEAQLLAARVDATIEVSGTGQKDLVTGTVGAAGVARLGLEADAVTWAAQRTYAESWFPDLDLVPTTGLVAELRVVKDDGEIERIAAACTIADAALADVRHRLAERPTEIEFGLELDSTVRRLGADDVSFETIVASGPNGALPHHRPDRRTIVDGDLVVIDFGALVDGYHSDMTRTVMVGEPSAVRAGVDAKSIDDACRAVIDEAGWLDAFLHSTGHGVGLDIHEEPRVSQTSTATLADRCVVTVEPGVYLPDHGGVRIEDTVVVTPDGCRPVTLAPKLAAL